MFKKIGEGIWSFKALINNEPHLQGVLNGVSSYYSDLKLQESPEARALVLTEFQTGRGERIDMLVHGIKFEGDDKNAKEYTPIGLELKASRQGKGAQALLKEANDQINKEYKKGVTYKTLTDGDEVKFIGVVFDKGAKKADSLILTSEKSIPVKVVHSSTLVLPTVGQCSKEREKRNIDMACVDSRDEEDITKEEKERRIKELLSDQMMMKIKLKKLESEISDEVLSRHEEIESVATYDVNKSDVLSNALQSLKLSKMLLLMSQKSEVSTELQEKAYYNALTDLGALIHDHKNHVHGDHLSALESRVHGNQLFSVAHDLYYLSKSEGNVDQDKLYSDQVKSKISSYVEGENGLDDIYSEFNIIDIKGYFSDSDIKDFYAEAEAYDKEVITIHSTQVFADGVEVYVEVKDSNGDYQKVVIGDVASIQNTENYILDEETSEIKLRIDDDKEYTTTQELEEGHVKHYLSIPGGYKVKVGNIISSFAENIKKAIHSKLHSLELSASKKDVEEISNAEITDRNYDNVVGEIKQNLLQKGVSEGTFNQLKDHLDSLGKKVFAEYISDVEKKLEGHEIEFDRSKFALAKANMSKGGKFFFLMAIYDLFDSINDVPTLGRHDNDALKKIFGINGILDAMDDVRESLSASYIRSDGKAVTKIPRDSAIGKVISKIPDSTRKTFVKIINNPVVQSITFATIAYQFGYSINEIVKGNHHPLNYYWTASSGIKLASMSIKPISVGVSSAMKGISSATKILRGLSTASKVLGKVAVVTMVADVFITIGVEIHERMEYTKAIAEQVPLLPGNEQAVVFFNWKDAGQRYEGIIRVKGYLNYIKDRAVHLLSAYNIAAVVQHVANIKEGYFITFDINTRNWEKRYLNISFDSIGMNFGTWVNLSSLDISKTLPMTLHALVMDEGWERFKCEFAFSARLECHRKINEKVVYIVNTDAKHVPHLTKCEYENLGLRIVSAPLECQVRKPQCDPQSAAAKDSAISKARRFMVNYNNEAYTDCTNTFTLSSEPFIFTKTTIGSSSPILYLLGPNRLTAAKNYPAVMVVPEGGVDYRGSTDHDNVFIINYDTYGHLIGGTKSNNTVVMNYNASTISVALHQYGTIRVEDSVIGLLNIPNYISHSTANQNITTGCKTRRVDAGEGGGNNSIQHYDVHCQDEDYEIRKVNKKDTHFRSAKQTTFIVDKNSGNGASIISSNNLESKKNLDTILIKNIDIAQLKINEHQADYSLELLTDDKRSTVTSTKIDSFENLVIQVEHYGIRKTITVQDKSLFDIIKDMEYQKLNHSGTGVSNKIIENSKKRSKAVILTDITVSEGLTAYGVAKDIINNNNLDIPISLVQVKKITGDVAHEAVVESMYSGEIVDDFSHENIGCKKIITIEAGSHESKCVVKFPQAYKCDYPVDFTLRVTNNPTPYANNAYDKMVDLTGCDINPEDVEYRADDGCAAGIILSSRVNQGSFQIVLDNYLRGPKYQHVAFQFIAFLIIVRTGHRKAESTARRKDSNRGMFFLALFFIANQ
ncbi:hypothetical protein [Wolbachia endosymbiont (group A) of Sphecodes monilicornis]|uniref:hypothetical protein n=1 Tax=Wolbachia endosymbiont (group A) of Sphecodes monilicornis TaxID=2954060 RepID=UPI00222654B5|nr:hypothetical protein [Wolbachia endosymbiont (group A) of Sphecodes monilicornis]